MTHPTEFAENRRHCSSARAENMDRYPKSVISFGSGQATENIRLSTMTHNVDENKIRQN